MPKPILFISLLLIFSGLYELKAQKGYEKGYVLTKAFDTIPGMVKDRKGPPFAKIYKKIRFKSSSPFVKKYSPKKIHGYVKGDEHFESHWILLNSRLFKMEYISRENIGKKYFLKVREIGFLTYYQWEFLDQESSTIDVVDLFKRRDEDYFVRVTQGIFGLKMNQLSEYFEDCPELLEKINSKELTKPEEIALFYNDWLEVK
ncbi:hypothetical protein [Shivajiella indica]|uniref:DUF4468 domain-containing protein n=1 Tax=Shivajiella indica TaxID=872115 RepID=A0ABW5BDZ6_9BACT